jgi:three-Cys-motif partner protein
MGGYVQKGDRYCEEVKWHTRKKHKFLEQYLRIWTERVGKKSKNIPSLDIVDLYASSGWCHCAALERPGEQTENTWEGTALLTAKYLNEYKGGRLLFLNTYNPNPEQQRLQFESLQSEVSKFPNITPYITQLPIESAVDEAIRKFNRRFPSLWILDPYSTQQLPWSVLEKICQTTGSYQDKGTGKLRVRRPELFINLMTHELQRNIDNYPDLFSQAIGLSEEVWRPKFEFLIGLGQNYRQAISTLYLEQLSRFYDIPPIMVEVYDTYKKAIIYCLILCTNSPAGNYVMRLAGLPEYNEWRVYEWDREAKTIVALQGVPKSQTSLDKWV